MNFEDEAAFARHQERIRDFCRSAVSANVVFNYFDSFGDRTFFISPDKPSRKYLDRLIVDFARHLGYKTSKVHAHLSIARGLDGEKMKTAYSIFKNHPVDFSFCCDAFYLRKFNEQTQQYSDIVEKFQFEEKPQPDLFSS